MATFGKGFSPDCPHCISGGTSCSPCSSGGTVNPDELPTFQNNGDGTVTDTRTGLIWLRNADCDGIKIWVNAGTWAAGLANGNCELSDGSTAGHQLKLIVFDEEEEMILQWWK